MINPIQTLPLSNNARVHILMATFQGEPFLQAQLSSIETQQHRNWTLTISDDGSTDQTMRICSDFARDHPGRVQLLQGPRKGATANFFHLINYVHFCEENSFYAFADQDDIWAPAKLSTGLAALAQLACTPDRPLLYCGRTRVVDEHLKPIGHSPTPRRPLGFGNAIVQNVVNGNTMVFNFSLLHLLRQVQPDHAVLHHWPAHLATTGCGGQLWFDNQPQILYRQHSKNVVGSQGRLRDRIERLRMIFKGQYREWGDQTEAILSDLGPYLTETARSQSQSFKTLRHEATALARVTAGWRSGIWRQTTSGQLSFYLALACKRL